MSTDTNLHTGSRSIQIIAMVVCTSLGACSWIPKGESGMDVGIKDRGIASWYGEQFHGKLAANGELFDMSALTAAHRTLPLGSIVRVVNLQNGKHVRVRINDRGPYVGGRILDLSYAAADQLGMVDGGISAIQLEVIGDHRPDFMIAAEESASVHAVLFALRQLHALDMATFSYPSLDRPDSAMTRLHRSAPNDMLLQRRWRWAPSMLATDPTNRDLAALMLA
jgi:rare lipoprotein A